MIYNQLVFLGYSQLVVLETKVAKVKVVGSGEGFLVVKS